MNFTFNILLLINIYCFSGGQKNKERYEVAWELAKRRKFEEIDPDIRINKYNQLQAIAKDYMEEPEDLPEGTRCAFWYYGKTGVGKTFSAKRDFPNAYIKIANNKWWDGYRGQDNVLIDDLDKKHDYMGYHLKIWGDRYAFQAEIKGSAIMLRPKAIVVTSNYHPKEIWDDPSTLEPILRRFKTIRFANLAEAMGLHEEAEEVRHQDIMAL